MKSAKFIFLLLVAALLPSCSNDAPSSDTCREEMLDVQLSFDFSINSSTSTRASRPLTSSDNWQQVTNLRLYVFKYNEDSDAYQYFEPSVSYTKGGVKSQVKYIDASSLFEKVDIWTSSDYESHSLGIWSAMPAGKYRFLAIGRDDDPDGTESNPATSNLQLNWTAVNDPSASSNDVTTWETAIMKNNSGTPCVSEIFSGFYSDQDGNAADINLRSSESSFLMDITLHRAVAGILMNVTNIPEQIAAEYAWHILNPKDSYLVTENKYTVSEVAIVSLGYEKVTDLVSRDYITAQQPDDSQTPSESGSEDYNSENNDNLSFTINNYKFTAHRILSITPHAENKNDVFNAGHFMFPVSLTGRSITPESSNLKLDEGIAAPSFDSSLYLGFFCENDGEYYPQKLMLIKIESSTGTDGNSSTQNTYHFDITANNIYCLGTKDDPIDLTKATELKITVYGSWQADVNIIM